MTGRRFKTLIGCSIFIFSCCTSPKGDANRKEAQVSVDVQPAFFSSTQVQPCKDQQLSLLQIVNDMSVRLAVSEGKDSAVIFGVKDPSRRLQTPVTPKGVQFFPVLSDALLIRGFTGVGSYNFQKDTQRIHQIDFRRKMAFIISHPPVYSNQMFRDMLSITDSTQGTLWLGYDFDAFEDRDAVGLMGRWQNSVYLLPRKHYDRLGVVLRGDTTYFDLKRKQ